MAVTSTVETAAIRSKELILTNLFDSYRTKFSKFKQLPWESRTSLIMNLMKSHHHQAMVNLEAESFRGRKCSRSSRRLLEIELAALFLPPFPSHRKFKTGQLLQKMLLTSRETKNK